MDNIRPRGNVELTCACGWSFWVDPLDPRLPGPIKCSTCAYPNHRWIKDPSDPNTAIAVPIDDLDETALDRDYALRERIAAMPDAEIALLWERLKRLN